jgi:hypothetical protein
MQAAMSGADAPGQVSTRVTESTQASTEVEPRVGLVIDDHDRRGIHMVRGFGASPVEALPGRTPGALAAMSRIVARRSRFARGESWEVRESARGREKRRAQNVSVSAPAGDGMTEGRTPKRSWNCRGGSAWRIRAWPKAIVSARPGQPSMSPVLTGRDNGACFQAAKYRGLPRRLRKRG